VRQVHRRAEGQARARHGDPAKATAGPRRQGNLERRRSARSGQRQDLQGALEAAGWRQTAAVARLPGAVLPNAGLATRRVVQGSYASISRGSTIAPCTAAAATVYGEPR